MNPKSDLKSYFENNSGNLINKWSHYFDIYEFWFRKYRGEPVVILEIGVFQGGSLKMWRDYFGKDAQIYGVDINPECRQFENENTRVLIGSQEDPEFLDYVKLVVPKVDILIDDGGHLMKQQILTFEKLYDHVKDEGIYLCEDLHTSYWEEYGGGYKKSNSFIEYSKNFIDYLNAWHSRDEMLKVNDFTKTAYSIHFYDSILIIQKALKSKPLSLINGNKVINDESFFKAYKEEEKRVRTRADNLSLMNRIKIFLRRFLISHKS